MIHRILIKTTFGTYPRKRKRYYIVAAYDIKKTKSGELIYYKHHEAMITSKVDQLNKAGYGHLKTGSLHNKSVISVVEEILDGR